MKPKHLFCILFFIAHYLTAGLHSFAQNGQPPSSFGYSTAKQRLQMKLTTYFVYFSLQARLEMDSAAILVSEGEQLPHSLYYDEDFADGSNQRMKDLLTKGCQYLFKSGTGKQDLDAALKYLLTAKSEADKLKDPYWQHAALSVLGRYYLQAGDVEESKNCFTKALDIARKSNDLLLLSRALANRGTYAGYGDKQKETDLNESLGLARQLRDTVAEIDMLTNIYQIYFVKGKFDTVKSMLLKVTELQKAIGYQHTHYNHRVLGYLEYTLGDWGDVFEQFKTAVTIMEANGDFAFSNFLYAAMAQIYSDFEDPEKALLWLDKSINRDPVNKAKRTWYRHFLLVCMDVAKVGHPQKALDFALKTISQYPPLTMSEKMNMAHLLGYCYHNLGQQELSDKQYAIMEPYLDSLKDDPVDREMVFSGYMDLARSRLATGNLKAMEKYFKRAIPFADSSNLFNRTRMHYLQFKIDSINGNYLKALNEYHLSRLLDDTIYNITKARQFSELQVLYETESKDKNIEILVQKDKVQQASIRQSVLVRNFTLAGILVMIIITALLYNQYRNKQKSNKAIFEKNKALEQLVKEKEWLVKEIHHRVKNNFHVVASLLEIQSSYLKNQDALSAIKDSQHRIHSMSIIHQKLYQSETLSTIHMPEYIYELVEYLRESYAIRQNIGFSLQVDKIELNHASAITLGLILNEAITNAIKYAFTETEEGKIAISLTYISDSQILLSIADNGRGLPGDFNAKIGASMGMELLQGLTDDLGGSFSIETNAGTQIKVIFDYKPVTATVPFS